VTVAAFLLALIAIFASAKIFGELAERVKQPAVLGELIGGVIVGVSGLRLVNPADQTIHLLAELGIILLLFHIGLETDLGKLISVGGSATSVAFVGVLLPFVGGFAFAYALGFRILIATLIGASLTATSVGITARVLSDLGQLKADESQVILGAAVVDDIIGLVLLTIVGTLAEGGALSTLRIGKIVLVAFGFVLLAIVIGSLLAPYLIRVIQHVRVARALFFASVLFALTLAYIALRVGSAVIIGSFAAGLVLARTERSEEIEREVHDLGQFFIPIFFVSVGAAVDLGALDRRTLFIGLGLTAIGIAGKVIAGFATLRRGLNRTVIGVGMIPRGEVGLIFAQIGLSTKLLDTGLYSAVAMMVLLTTFVTPPLLRVLLRPLSSRA
jgi:Na+:H+ antiporter